MREIYIELSLFEEVLDQLKRAQQDAFVPYTQKVIEQLEVLLTQPEKIRSVPRWILEYNRKNYQSSAGKAIRELLQIIEPSK